ncbi:MAG: hypothetical protein AB4372_15645 [Xenococcus sp. (in: cyanobacteria)]
MDDKRDRAAPASQTTQCQALPDRTIEKIVEVEIKKDEVVRELGQLMVDAL